VEEEQQAHERLEKARRLLAENKVASARIYLEVVVKKYPTTTAAREARQFLEKIGP
jgi:TolA-binding protein